ncbi:MAG: phosphate signaling complex protein PhoU [Ignavibacteriae bacterium]|nr:phosphate signaling complex protein PhoU [Ignavibacteriota bacterium]
MYQYLEEELDLLKTKVIKMGSLVEEQLEFAVKSLFEGNLEMGKIVIERDSKVDKYDVKIDKLCQKIFALTQPVAVDLRLIMSALKINNDLERMGDIAVNIAERAEPLANNIDLLKRVQLDIMAEKVMTVVQKAIDSFVNNDHEIALSVIKSDDIIDEMDRTIFYKLIDEMTKDSSLVNAGAHSISLLRHLERLADHSTNIAEEVIFLVDAKIIKHKNNLDNLDIKSEEII